MVPASINQISSFLGSDPLIIQGGGGNISFKDSSINSIWIKASGKWLENAQKENVYLELALDKGKNWLASGEDDFPLDWQKNETHNNTLRASIETSLHLLFDEAVVVHTHPVNILAHVVQKNPQDILSSRLGNINWALAPYVKPGRDLANAIGNHPNFRQCKIFILQNHGLVVCAGTPEQAQDTSLNVIDALSLPVRNCLVDLTLLNTMVLSMAQFGYRLPSNPKIHQLACDPLSLQSISQVNNVLYPDQAVFLGKNAYLIDGFDQMTPGIKAPYIVIPQLGVFIQESASVMVEVMLLCHAEVLSRINDESSLNYLSDDQVAELTNWDAEKYRQSIN
ncbi:MAG: class II aldolase [Polynucleobacter sp.]|nr:class II aldolase [Polynucleobacter sp.]